MQSAPAGSNPFAVLTAVVAPAILTNASSILALGTSNRLARVVDRTRFVVTQLADLEPGSGDHQDWSRQLEGLRTRAQLLVKALRATYASLGLFAAAALVSVAGSIFSYYAQQVPFEVCAFLAIVTGGSAVIGLSSGCLQMVRETRLAVRNLAEEARITSARHAPAPPPSQ